MMATVTWATRPLLKASILGLGVCLAASAVSAGEGQTAAHSHGSSGGDRWGESYFPNVVLTSHEGEELRFFDDMIKGKVVVINFIYTTCPDVCPLETAKVSEIQAILGDRVGKDVFLYSITIDPETDTPEVLADYAEMYGAGSGWKFMTGKEADIVLLRKKLGLYIDDIQGEDSNDHNTSLLIGNQLTGRWMKRSPFEDPYFLADQVGSWLHNWKTPATNQDSYANAPSFDSIDTGLRLFRTRCASCHVIGEVVPEEQNGRLIGPDLFGVTERRDPAWLARWIAEPDKMLAEKDPLALELFEKHNRVPMPNMALNKQDVAAIVEFIETESRRVAATRTSTAARAETVADAGGEPAECCQKGGTAVVKGSDLASTGSADPMIAPARRSLRVIQYGSIGAGVLFLLLSTFLRRRGQTWPTGAPSTDGVEINQ